MKASRPTVPTSRPRQTLVGVIRTALPQAASPGTSLAKAAAPAVNHADPTAVAHAYVTVRLTYRFDDPTGYARAVTAPAYTTAAFAARSRPDIAALTRVRSAQEVSTVKVLAVRVDGEAPNTASARYVQVSFTSTLTYRGDGSGRPQRQVWTLRLVQQLKGRWLVDGVPGTS
jgi:hypothetical protein